MNFTNVTYKVSVLVIHVHVGIVFANTVEIKGIDCSFNDLYLNMRDNLSKVKMIKMIQ